MSRELLSFRQHVLIMITRGSLIRICICIKKYNFLKFLSIDCIIKLFQEMVLMWFWFHKNPNAWETNFDHLLETFLALLSQRLTRRAYRIARLLSIRRLRHHPHFPIWISMRPVGQSCSNFMCNTIGVGEFQFVPAMSHLVVIRSSW